MHHCSPQLQIRGSASIYARVSGHIEHVSKIKVFIVLFYCGICAAVFARALMGVTPGITATPEWVANICPIKIISPGRGGGKEFPRETPVTNASASDRRKVVKTVTKKLAKSMKRPRGRGGLRTGGGR